jgi:hypothetical protein
MFIQMTENDVPIYTVGLPYVVDLSYLELRDKQCVTTYITKHDTTLNIDFILKLRILTNLTNL